MNPCADCPFRTGSSYAYDAGATEALDDGAIPSCHKFVGLDSVFSEAIPTNPCAGFERWHDGAIGFRKPEQEPA